MVRRERVVDCMARRCAEAAGFALERTMYGAHVAHCMHRYILTWGVCVLVERGRAAPAKSAVRRLYSWLARLAILECRLSLLLALAMFTLSNGCIEYR